MKKLAQRDPPVNGISTVKNDVVIEISNNQTTEQQKVNYALFWQLLLGRLTTEGKK